MDLVIADATRQEQHSAGCSKYLKDILVASNPGGEDQRKHTRREEEFMWRPEMKFGFRAIALACTTLLSACGGGGGSSTDGGAVQAISFNFPGGPAVAVPPDVATTKLVATASGGGPVTFTANTPATCSVNGDVLSVLKAGECSVTANQAGGDGYAPASQSQLFVIPKQTQRIVFRNPGSQPLDSATVTLAATSSVAGRTVTFTSSTPAVCTVSANTLTKVTNGICTVTATQAGDDIYASVTSIKNIPIGSATSPALTFLTGYKDSSHTKEGGAISGSAGTNMNGWWCNGSCTTVVPADGTSFAFGFNLKLNKPADGSWMGGYWGMSVMAAGLDALAKAGDTVGGVHIDAQAALKFNLAQNIEWFSSSNNKVNVELTLGHFALKNGKDACNVTLRAVLMPTTAAASDYSLGLKENFKISESCGLTGLDLWNELQDYPISKINFGADSMNVSVSSTGLDKPTYPTQLTLTGPITFQ
jgi:hypothetical protein